MSILRPKDGDYIVRGIILLVGWTFLGWVPFAFVGGVLAGAGGATISALISVGIIGPFLFGLYLRLEPSVYQQRLWFVCECGHKKDSHHSSLGCIHRWSYYSHGPGCRCMGYRLRLWWRANSQDANDWSV